MQLVPSAPLLARVDRAWSQRDALPDASGTRTHDRVSDGDDQPLVSGHAGGSHPTMQPGTAPVRRGHVAREAEESLGGGIFAQSAGEVVEGYLDPRAGRHGGDDSSHHRAAEGLAGGYQWVAQAEALVELGRIAASGKTQGGLAPIVSHSPVPG